MQQEYKGFTIRTTEHDNELYWLLDDDDNTIASSLPNAHYPGTGYATEGEASRSAKGKVNNLLRKGY